MTQTVRDWLPAEVAERAAVRAPVASAVADWSSHWFATAQLSLSSWALATAPRGARAAWRACGGGFEVSCSGRATARLLGLALDARPDDADLNDRDRSLSAAFSAALVDDLIQRVRRAVGPDADAGGDPTGPRCVIAIVSDGADEILSLAIPFPALLGLCRRSLPTSPRAADPPDSRRCAVERTRHAFQATLGTVTVSLAEAQGLSAGDILVLDRTLSDAADLCLTPFGPVVARGVMTEADGHVALLLQPPQESSHDRAS